MVSSFGSGFSVKRVSMVGTFSNLFFLANFVYKQISLTFFMFGPDMLCSRSRIKIHDRHFFFVTFHPSNLA